MKHIIIIALTLALSATTCFAQEVEENYRDSLSTQGTTAKRYGYVSIEALTKATAEYADAQEQLKTLRKKLDAEIEYNETNFHRQFAEFLEGQKEFPEVIMLKRQRDLQEQMEKSLAFRRDADKLYRDTEKQLMNHVRNIVDKAIAKVGAEQHYDFIVNTDGGAYPFLNPTLCEDAMPAVKKALGIKTNLITTE